MVVEAVGLVVGDDDGALAPDVRTAGDGVDHPGCHGLADLPVGVAGVVIVTGLGIVDRRHLVRRGVRVGDGGGQAHLVAVAATDIDDAAVRQIIVGEVAEEVALTPEAGA
jgi:hypothetical protein